MGARAPPADDSWEFVNLLLGDTVSPIVQVLCNLFLCILLFSLPGSSYWSTPLLVLFLQQWGTIAVGNSQKTSAGTGLESSV